MINFYLHLSWIDIFIINIVKIIYIHVQNIFHLEVGKRVVLLKLMMNLIKATHLEVRLIKINCLMAKMRMITIILLNV